MKLTELSPEQKRIIAAEACGWRWHGHESWVHSATSHYWSREDIFYATLPDYGASLDAMAGAEATLTEDEHHAFRCKLWEFASIERTASRYERRYFSSTASQRIDAFLLAKNLCE